MAGHRQGGTKYLSMVTVKVTGDNIILVLPVYTAKTESFYKSKNSKNEWVTGKDQSIVFSSK